MNMNVSWVDSFVSRLPPGDVVLIADECDDAPTQYRWSSPHLNGLSDPLQIGARAAALKAIYDGALYIYCLGDYFPWQIGRPVEADLFQDDCFSLVIATEPFSPDWKNWRFAASESPFLHRVSLYLFLAHFDETVKNMMMFLGVNGPTWITLYALKDFIGQAGWSEQQMATGAGVSVAEVKRFRATANNFAAIGPYARHGELGWQPPSSPMGHEEAKNIMIRCVRAFFNQQISAKNLREEFETKVSSANTNCRKF